MIDVNLLFIFTLSLLPSGRTNSMSVEEMPMGPTTPGLVVAPVPFLIGMSDTCFKVS